MPTGAFSITVQQYVLMRRHPLTAALTHTHTHCAMLMHVTHTSTPRDQFIVHHYWSTPVTFSVISEKIPPAGNAFCGFVYSGATTVIWTATMSTCVA